jgi:hypothetical protein
MPCFRNLAFGSNCAFPGNFIISGNKHSALVFFYTFPELPFLTIAIFWLKIKSLPVCNQQAF